jgi:hypothetical protein
MPLGGVRIWPGELDETIVEASSLFNDRARDPLTLQAIGGIRETVEKEEGFFSVNVQVPEVKLEPERRQALHFGRKPEPEYARIHLMVHVPAGSSSIVTMGKFEVQCDEIANHIQIAFLRTLMP